MFEKILEKAPSDCLFYFVYHGYKFLLQKHQLTRRNARQQRAHMMRSVHLHRHDVLTVLSL